MGRVKLAADAGADEGPAFRQAPRKGQRNEKSGPVGRAFLWVQFRSKRRRTTRGRTSREIE
ncbi:hypothetical protein BSLA_01r4175 [Burkholderia stabilis]|nr:hypothetical protein BSLA_01r4175 [Burkholderia stabilis]